MKKYIVYVMLLFVLLILSSGCFKKSPEVVLCDKIQSKISQYDSKQISYDELANQLSADYDESCSNNEQNNVCLDIKSIIDLKNETYEIQDCSVYKNKFKEMYDVCVSNNNLIRESIKEKTQFEKANVTNLSTSCARAREK